MQHSNVHNTQNNGANNKSARHSLSARSVAFTLGTALLSATPAWAIMEKDIDDEWLDDTYAVLELIGVYDKNNDGLLSEAEVQQAASSEMNGFDNNRDQQLSLAEFEQLWQTELQQYTQREFSAIDSNNSSDLNSAELVVNYKQIEKRLFNQSCLTPYAGMEQEYQQEASYEIAELDDNRDGRISYAEFSKVDRRDMVEDFRDIDVDGNGQITMAEHRAALGDLAREAEAVKRELPVRC